MAYRRFSHIKIIGVAAAVPKQIKCMDSFAGHEVEAKKVSKMVGIEERHIANAEICSSDLCYAAAERLLSDLKWERNSVDALIFLSQTPDYILPATSCVLQHKLGISTNCAAFDMSLGCSGYIYGLLTAFGLVSANGVRRVLLLVGDTISKVLSPNDIPANVLFGDAGTATAIEYDPNVPDSYITVGTDGAGAKDLIIEAGGFRKPKDAHTNVQTPHAKDSVLRSEEDLFMDGSAVFSFTLSRVPEAVNQLLELSEENVQDVDFWLFHQANKFMLDNFAKKMKISPDKMLINIDKFGNTSPPSIPLLMVTEGLQNHCNDYTKIALVGFGVGFSWGGALLQVKDIITPPLIIV